MKSIKVISTILFSMVLVGVSASTFADHRRPRVETPRIDRADLHQDKKELRYDRRHGSADFRHDRREFRRDKREFRHDIAERADLDSLPEGALDAHNVISDGAKAGRKSIEDAGTYLNQFSY
ncbi:MAG: hypothetical protein QNK11_07395 [Legionella sp.]|nr:hypothetical protein [Legionella sp.]